MTDWKIPSLTSVLLLVATAVPATAQSLEKVKVAASWVGLWDTSQPTFCKERGAFQKAGLDVDIISVRGGSETVQAVTSGSADIAYSPGVNAVLAAYMQGAKIKIISSEFIGGGDSFWYVRADSPIKTIADFAGKTIGFPRPGGASEAVLLALKRDRKMDFKMVATGGFDATYTMIMTKQVDSGYSGPPSGLEQEKKGEIRIIFSGDDVPSVKDIIGRVNIASTDFLTKRRPVAVKFMQVLNECVNWAYANPDESLKMFAALNKVTDPDIAKRSLQFYKREALAFSPLKGFDEAVRQAVEGKFIDKAPTEAQLKDLIDLLLPN
ncbi:MAG: ABC transporter substrate-binding protein [Pseudorhodoplanes sp.]